MPLLATGSERLRPVPWPSKDPGDYRPPFSGGLLRRIGQTVLALTYALLAVAALQPLGHLQPDWLRSALDVAISAVVGWAAGRLVRSSAVLGCGPCALAIVLLAALDRFVPSRRSYVAVFFVVQIVVLIAASYVGRRARYKAARSRPHALTRT